MPDETSKFDLLNNTINRGFDRLHDRIDKVDDKLNETNIKVAGISTEMKSLKENRRMSIAPKKLNGKVIKALLGVIVILGMVIAALLKFL